MSDPIPPSHVSRRSILVGGATVAGAAEFLSPAALLAADPRSGGQSPPSVEAHLKINGTERHLALDPRVTLLDALREHLGLTGTKKGCDHGQCGACTVIVNGYRINSCLTLAVMHDGDEVTTIEGLGRRRISTRCRPLS
jgi:xanthine dehydrogenase YagT iron-sulfur-binding subunit